MRALDGQLGQPGAGVDELRTEVQQNASGIRDLTARMEALARLEERVAALDKRSR
jgi:hypothetical protein